MKIIRHVISESDLDNLPRVTGQLIVYESKEGVPYRFQWGNKQHKPPRVTISRCGIYLNNTSYNLLGRQRQLSVGYHKGRKILLISKLLGNDRAIYNASASNHGATILNPNLIEDVFGIRVDKRKYEPLWSIENAALVVMMDDFMLPDEAFEHSYDELD